MPGFALTPLIDPLVRVLLAEDSGVDVELLVALLEDELPGVTVALVSTAHGARPTDTAPVRAPLRELRVLVMTGGERPSVEVDRLPVPDDYLVTGSEDDPAVIAAAVLAASRRQTALVQAQRYQRLAMSLLDAMETPVCVVDPDGVITAVNAAWQGRARQTGGDPARTGVGASYLAVCDDAGFLGSPGAAEVAQGVRDVLHGTEPSYGLDYPCSGPTDELWFRLRVLPLPDGGGAVLVHGDISEEKRATIALSHQAMHDQLTGLPNRQLLGDRLSQALSWAGRAGRLAGVAMLDLDGFKRVNDSLGHSAGDELLRAVGVRLAEQVTGVETLARFAGDQFVAVWTGATADLDAEERSSQLQSVFDKPFVIEGASVQLTASVGLALGAPPQTADELLLAAGAAMDDAKSRGRGRVRMFSPELRVGAEHRLLLESELRAGLTSAEFVLHYQPVVDLQAMVVVGVEALVRWQHPDGLRMPDAFIPIAESSGLIVPLGAWVLQEACRQGAQWAAAGVDLDIAVNLSARQVSHPEITETIAAALQEAGLSPGRLEIEVTESAVVQDAEAALLALRQIVALGVRVAIDDFGTGYSSLLYLKRYPLNALKVDRSFVSGMGLSIDDDAIVASVISLAHAVGAVCIAEGVETVEQCRALQTLGCRYAQGYLFSRPVSAAELPNRVIECNQALSVKDDAPRRRRRPWDRSVQPAAAARIRELHLSGASLHTIAAALNQEGMPSDHGGRWVSTAVARAIAGDARADP